MAKAKRAPKKKAVVPSPVELEAKQRELSHETLREKSDFKIAVMPSENTFDPKQYKYDDRFKPADTSNFLEVHTIPEMLEHLQHVKTTETGGMFLAANTERQYRYKKIPNKAAFHETWGKLSRKRTFREFDSWADTAGANAGLVGDDFVPLLGGPFNKQPYMYDYLRAHSYCFHEYHHHPFARAIVNITRDFVLGGGYRIDSEDTEALAMWRAFEQVNRLEEMMEQVVTEGSIFGETMIWWLPNQTAYITYDLPERQMPKRCAIPRIRLLDPSTCWDIITYPEDITRVLFYWLVFPTQYQLRGGMDQGASVPTAKFIQQQLPAEDVMHFKYNCMSNEKRGRSDLFPVLGYLKWVRDCVNYKLIALKKQAAWTEDLSVDGSQADIDAIIAALKALGSFEPAGSRFVHSKKIERKYLDTPMSASEDHTLQSGIDMIAAGTQIPVSYFGITKAAGQTKASAIVGTEPVAKKMERRQIECKRILMAMWRKFQDKWGKRGSECEITFPEIITQDRSIKLKDIKFTEDAGYISKERAANMAAKEIGADKSYDYDLEREKILSEDPAPIEPTLMNPLTAPSLTTPSAGGASSENPKSSGVTKADRRATSKNGVA